MEEKDNSAVDTTSIVEKELSDLSVYEAGFLLDPKLGADEQLAFANSLRDKVEKAGGEYIAHETPKEMTLAYKMSRTQANKKEWFEKAHFGWFKFALLPAEIIKIEKDLKEDESVIRYLLIKTVRENTMHGKHLRENRRPRHDARKRVKEDEGEVNKEEVDKKVDEILSAE